MSDQGDPGPATHSGERSALAARQVILGAIAFLATLGLLFGLASLVARSAPPGSPRASSAAAAQGGSSPGAGTSSSAGATASLGPGSAKPSIAASASTTAAASSSGPVSPSPGAASASPGSASASPGAESPTASSSGETVGVLVGAGDIASCGLTADSRTADLIAAIPGTVFTAGDNAYENGTTSEFRDCYAPTWGRFLDRTKPAPGNHDHNTKDLAGYLDYFGAAAAPNGTSWYSYDLGTWHVIVLDSSCDLVGGCGPDSAEGRWLAADLAASSATCTMAIWHHPRWSSGEHGSDKDVAPFWTALYAAGADVVVNGHDHDYERFGAQDPNGHPDGARGIREFVVGTGGAALRPFRPSFLQAANSELRDSVDHGVIRFVLHPSSYDWTFIPTGNGVRDQGTAFCH